MPGRRLCQQSNLPWRVLQARRARRVQPFELRGECCCSRLLRETRWRKEGVHCWCLQQWCTGTRPVQAPHLKARVFHQRVLDGRSSARRVQKARVEKGVLRSGLQHKGGPKRTGTLHQAWCVQRLHSRTVRLCCSVGQRPMFQARRPWNLQGWQMRNQRIVARALFHSWWRY